MVDAALASSTKCLAERKTISHTYAHTCTCIYIYMYVHICLCLYIYGGLRQRNVGNILSCTFYSLLELNKNKLIILFTI